MNKLKSWTDLANHYNLVLFNNMVNIEDGAVLMEWTERRVQP